MDAKFKIQVEPGQNLIRITLSGFFSARDVDSFVIARNAAHADLTSQTNMHLTLCDIRDIKIQAQEIVGAFHHVLSDDEYRSRKLAVVVASSLARHQLQRAAAGRFFCVFTSVEDALLWLNDDDGIAPDAPLAPVAVSMPPVEHRRSF